jgi:DNA-binding NarL/FixJ family response regulator
MLADEHIVLRKGVRHLIESHSGWEVCAEAADGNRALELACREKPSVAVVEVALPDLDGLEFAKNLHATSPSTNVLFFTARDDVVAITRAMAVGARGYVLKTDSREELESGISAVGANRVHFSPYVTELLLNLAGHRERQNGGTRLSGREIDVIGLMSRGNCNREIAHILGISIKTVETHRTAAMSKTGLNTGVDLVRFAIKHRMVEL